MRAVTRRVGLDPEFLWSRNKSIFSRSLSSSRRYQADFTHVIVGAGVVGLAIAEQLSRRVGSSTLLLDKRESFGTETSSRNSEVIHAGLYYGHDSLKTKLCLRGKELMYELCKRKNINFRKCGKWIVCQDDEQNEEVDKVHQFAKSIGVPTRWISKSEAERLEPSVRATAGVLESESTGIVDSHGLMTWLEGEFLNQGGEVVYGTEVGHIEHLPGDQGYRVDTRTTANPGAGSTAVTAETVINSAGLYAISISNMLLPPERQIQPFYAKGTYFSYSAQHPKPSRLIYPAPRPGHGGLGTHLTLDLSEPPRVRFGPDVEWVDSPTDYAPNESRLAEALDDIQTYLPGLKREAVQVDYCGIRPKLGKLGAVVSGKGFQDFVIRKEEGHPNFINLLGIESPGLTSSLAIAEEVRDLLYK